MAPIQGPHRRRTSEMRELLASGIYSVQLLCLTEAIPHLEQLGNQIYSKVFPSRDQRLSFS